MDALKDVKDEAGVDLATIETEAKVLSDLKRGNPSLTIFTLSSPFFAQVRKLQFLSITSLPLAIVWPHSETDVASVVKYALAHNIPFCVRSGGHDAFGRSMQEGMLVIDMRCMNKVEIADDKKTASVQGGALLGNVANKLAEKGLVTTIGACASVSYAGFAMFGGYGAISGIYGMGNDNIVGARLVNSKGDIVKANEDLLYGIRGAGGAFGIVTELKVNTYDMETFIAGMMVFQSDNLEEQVPSFFKGYQALLANGTPAPLGLYLAVATQPQVGRSLAVFVTWASQDHEAADAYFAKIRALGTVVMEMVAPMRPVDFLNMTTAASPFGSYGALRSAHVETISDKFIQVFTRNALKMPLQPGSLLILQPHHGKAAQPNADSCFPAREPHFLMEIIGMTMDEGEGPACAAWVKECHEDFDASGVCSSGGYISTMLPGSVPVQGLYGSNYEKVLSLKKMYDPDNLFKNAYPKFDY